MGKYLFWNFIRDCQGRKRKVDGGYLCKVIKNGVEQISVLNFQSLIDAGVLTSNYDEDEEDRPSLSQNEPSYDKIIMTSSATPFGAMETPILTEYEPIRDEVGPSAEIQQDNPRPGPSKRSRDDEQPEVDERDHKRRLTGSAVVAEAIKDIQKEEEAGRARRLEEKRQILIDLQDRADKNKEKRMQNVLDFLKMSRSMRQKRIDMEYQDKIKRFRCCHDESEYERGTRHENLMQDLLSSHGIAGGTANMACRDDVQLLRLFHHLEESDAEERIKRELKSCTNSFLEER